MQFLKILFWCLLAFVAAVFTLGNWTTVPIKLWGGLVAEVNLPLLLLVTFLLGLVPTMVYYHAVRWRLRNRLATSERTLTDLRGILTPPVPAIDAEPAIPPALPAAAPTAVPPGGA
jgi:putative membrane protein